MKTFSQLLSESISQIKLNGNIRLANNLCWIHDVVMMLGDEESAKQAVQKESLYWTGQNEEDFPALKLLRMKAYNTI